jgi:hypothetical protein
MYSSGNHIVSSKSYTINPGSEVASHDGAGFESGFESVGSTNARSVCCETRLVLTLFDRRGRTRSRSRFALHFAPLELMAHDARDIGPGEDPRRGAEECGTQDQNEDQALQTKTKN